MIDVNLVAIGRKHVSVFLLVFKYLSFGLALSEANEIGEPAKGDIKARGASGGDGEMEAASEEVQGAR